MLFKHKADGSLVKDAKGQVVGSSLIGQDFTKKEYFHPRPEADDYASGPDYSYGSNYGPTNPALIGNVPGVSIDDKTNPYATPSDPYCVPVQSTDKDDNPITDKAGNPVYDKNKDGTYVCDPNTVPQRVLAYRAENGLGPGHAGSGRRGDRVGQRTRSAHHGRERQAPGAARRGRTSHAARPTVLALVKSNTDERAFGILGEPGVNVLELNLALDRHQRTQ